MRTDPIIKFSQLLLLIFLSMLFPFMLISGEILSRIGIWSAVIWAALSLIKIPVLYFISNRVLILKGIWGAVVRVLALVFLLLMSVKFTVMFTDFFGEIVNTGAQRWIVTAVMLIAAVYGVVRGIRGLSASSIIFGALTVLMLVLLVIGAVPEVMPDHVTSSFGNDANLADFILLLISLDFVLPLMLILNSDTGKPKTSAIIWVPLMLMLAEALIILLTVACLGKYAFTQPYPIMSLFRAPTMNMLESVSGVWFLTLTVLALIAISSCLSGASALAGAPRSKAVSVTLAAAVFIGCLLQENNIIDVYGRMWIYVLAVLAVLSALLCMVTSRRKKEGDRK